MKVRDLLTLLIGRDLPSYLTQEELDKTLMVVGQPAQSVDISSTCVTIRPRPPKPVDDWMPR